jgi:hypothetical protein
VEELAHSLNFCILSIYLVFSVDKQLVSFLLSIVAITPGMIGSDND